MSGRKKATVGCQTEKSGAEKPKRKRRKSVAAAVAEILERGDNEDDLRKLYDNYDDSSDDDEDIYENIKVQKEIVESVRYQPWTMAKKKNLVRLSKSYVEKHEGQLSRSRGYQEKGAQVWRRIKREVTDLVSLLTPWDNRMKAIESHFGSVVASYFLFLRWLVGINLLLTMIPLCFVIVPELIAGDPHGSVNRKQIPEQEMETYADLKTIWDAEGIVKYSVIFYGYYGNSIRIGAGNYRLPLAYLLATFASFAFSFIVVLRKMASNTRQSRLTNKDEQFTFSWKLWCSWDYTIGHSETANTKVASIVTTFKELILEEKEKEKEMNKYTLFGLRVLANVGVLMLLALSTYIIQLCVERSRELDIRKRQEGHVDTGFWQENELTLVMTIISTIFPNFFDLLSLLEKYHPRVNLRWQLARIFALNLLNLYTLFIALFWKQQDMKKALQEMMTNLTANCNNTLSSNDTVNHVISDSAYNCSTNDITSGITSDLCWETMIGQEVFKLTVMDLVFIIGQIILQDYLRGLFVRYCNVLCCWDLETKFPEYGDFKTAENLLHLINNQGVIWLGTFFAPGLAILNFLKLIALLYTRCWSVMVCNVPQEGIFRSSRSNNFYYALLLFMLFLSMLPPLFAIVAVEPSPHCGPFSGKKQILQILTDTIENDLPAVAATAMEYAVSPFVILPVFMLLAMTIYYLVVVTRSLRDANKELRNQLEYERTEGKRKIYAMADAKWELNTDGTNIQNPNDHKKGPGKKPGPSKAKSGMGKTAMSVLAAARVAKMLSSKPVASKVSPAPPAVKQKTFMSSAANRRQSQHHVSAETIIEEQPMMPQNRTVAKTSRDSSSTIMSRDSGAAKLSRDNSSSPTPVAVVPATQKIRKKVIPPAEGNNTGNAASRWRRAGHMLVTPSTQQVSSRRRQSDVLSTNDIIPIIEESDQRSVNIDINEADESDVILETNLTRMQKYKLALLKQRRQDYPHTQQSSPTHSELYTPIFTTDGVDDIRMNNRFNQSRAVHFDANVIHPANMRGFSRQSDSSED